MVYNWLKRAQTLLFPPYCILCQQRGTTGKEICLECTRRLSWNLHCCKLCAAPLPPEADDYSCGQCLKSPPSWARAISPLLYTWPLNQLLQRFKFNADLATGRLLGELLADFLAAGRIVRPDLLIPVPLHPQRLRTRGFNQALELARPVANRLHLRIASHLCVRTKNTAVQSELEASARRKNLQAAFTVTQSLTGTHVAILDDVLTTGATASSLTDALRQAEAASVQVWCLARAARLS